MSRTLALCTVLLLLACPPTAAAARYAMDVVPDRPDGVFKSGEEVAFRIVVLRDGRPLVGQQVSYTIATGDGEQVASGSGAIGGKPLIAKAKVDGPAVVTCTASYSTGSISDSEAGSALVAPELFKPALPPPDDFDAFWQAQRELLAAAPAEPVVTPAEAKEAGLVVSEVRVPTVEGVAPLRALFARPKEARARSLPAILYPQSAGSREFLGVPRPPRPMRRPPAAGNRVTRGPSSRDGADDVATGPSPAPAGPPADAPAAPAADAVVNTGAAVRAAKLRMLALEFNFDDLPNPFAAKPGEPASDADREKHFLRSAILRQQRAIEFLTRQPQWNGKVLVVQGYGIGGGLALAAAGLDERVTLCVAGAPAMCDLGAEAAGRAGWPLAPPRAPGAAPAPVAVDEKTRQAARYFDAANFAARIKCPVVMTVAFHSAVAPPAGVYAAYAAIPAATPKQILRAGSGDELKQVQSQVEAIVRKHVIATSAGPR